MTGLGLAEWGVALFGPRFRVDLADALGVSERTVRRWLAGEWVIPEGVKADLKKLRRTKQIQLKKLET
jgi:hypothetical protein